MVFLFLIVVSAVVATYLYQKDMKRITDELEERKAAYKVLYHEYSGVVLDRNFWQKQAELEGQTTQELIEKDVEILDTPTVKAKKPRAILETPVKAKKPRVKKAPKRHTKKTKIKHLGDAFRLNDLD